METNSVIEKFDSGLSTNRDVSLYTSISHYMTSLLVM